MGSFLKKNYNKYDFMFYKVRCFFFFYFFLKFILKKILFNIKNIVILVYAYFKSIVTRP